MLSVSIVLFHHCQQDMQDLLTVLGASAVVEKVWLIDNGGSQWAGTYAAERAERFVYINVGRNVGFGTAHNV